MDIKARDILIVAGIILLFFYLWNGEEEVLVEDPPIALYQTEDVEVKAEPIEENEENEEPEPVVQETEKVVVEKPAPTPHATAKYPNLDDSFAAFDEQGNRFIEQVNKVGKHLVYHGDVLIGDASELPRLMKNKVIKVGKSIRWPGGHIPYVIDDNVPQEENVIEAVEYLNTFTNIKIVPRENEEDYVLLTRGEADCYSYAGRKGGKQEIFVVPQCGVRELIHEWMHTIGFLHEQNREDRDEYIQIIWDNIDEINRPQFKKLPNDYMGVMGRPFDFQSIMLYSSETFSMYPGEPALLTRDGDLIPHTENLLSDEDIKRVNLAYPTP